jgi:hypothetical protein
LHEFRFFLGLVIPFGFLAAIAAFVLVVRRAVGYRSAIAACGAVLLSAVPAANMGRGIAAGNWSSSLVAALLLTCGIVYLAAVTLLATVAVRANRRGDLHVLRPAAATLAAAVVVSYGALYFFAAQSSGG